MILRDTFKCRLNGIPRLHSYDCGLMDLQCRFCKAKHFQSEVTLGDRTVFIPVVIKLKGSTPGQVAAIRSPDAPSRVIIIPVQDTILKPLPSLAKDTSLNQKHIVKTLPLPSTPFAKDTALNQEDIIKTLPLPSTSFAKDTALNQNTSVKPLPLPNTCLIQNESGKFQAKIDALKKKCTEQRKIIKRLNEKVRRRDKKLAVLTDIIQELEKVNLVNNEKAIDR